LKRLYDLSLAVNACKQVGLKSEKAKTALHNLERAQSDFESVMLSQRLSENEKARG
jgi:hypothetical protein